MSPTVRPIGTMPTLWISLYHNRALRKKFPAFFAAFPEDSAVVFFIRQQS
jgi:hypothetical protein